MELNLKFDVKDKRVVEIIEEGEIDILALYRSLREWEASEAGIVFEEIINYSGGVELPDGTKTPATLIFVNDWQLSSKNEISIIGGYITGKDRINKYVNPISSESRFTISVLSNPDDETSFVPTEAQKKYAHEQGELFALDWKIVTSPKPIIQRKKNASKKIHTVFALYWFLKLERLRNEETRKFDFPLIHDNQIPRDNIVRHYELKEPWSIKHSDLQFLAQGPVIWNKEIIVPVKTIKKDLARNYKIDIEEKKERKIIFNFFRRLNPFKKSTKTKRQNNSVKLGKSVTIGIVTALPKEHAAMSIQIDNQEPFVVRSGRFNSAISIGEIPAFNGGIHKVALTMCEMGNNRAAITATQLAHQFPNLQEIIMVGIAGAVPNPSNYEDHVRLGDIVVSGQKGVIQYDMIKQLPDGRVEYRYQPRPPSNHMLQSVFLLESEKIAGKRPWMDALGRTKNNTRFKRPHDSKDILYSTDDPTKVVQHPNDPDRIDEEPKVFIGAIGAGNKLLKNPKERDELMEKLKVKAIEMESSGISDATKLFGLEYLVVRGTCDYCDSHKNDDWQNYAAAVASSYCRVLLEKTPRYDQLIN